MFTYQIGWPFWKIAARVGFPLRLRVEVFQDLEEGGFVARSADFLKDGGVFVCEGDTVQDLEREIRYTAIDLLEEILHVRIQEGGKPRIQTIPTLSLVPA